MLEPNGSVFKWVCVMFKRNVQLDLSNVAMTLALRMLYLKLMLQILSESRWFKGVGMVQGCEGMRYILGV